MSRKYTQKNPWLIKWILKYLMKQARYIKQPMQRKWAKEEIRALAYRFGLDYYWREN